MKTALTTMGPFGLLVLLAAAGPPVRAQGSDAGAVNATAKLPVYDVSTVKPNTSDSGNVSVWTRSANFTAENVALKELLEGAFNIRESLIFGLPPWALKTRWNIEAKIVDPDEAQLKTLTDAQRQAMLQALYADRFALTWHFETKVMPTLELVVDKGGAKFKEATDPNRNSVSQRNSDLKAAGIPLSRLTDMLSRETGQQVVDKTGLDKRYDFELRWTREQDAGKDDGTRQESEAAPPNIYTALKEQLGLRLESGKAPVKTLVIDRCNPPTPN